MARLHVRKQGSGDRRLDAKFVTECTKNDGVGVAIALGMVGEQTSMMLRGIIGSPQVLVGKYFGISSKE